MKLHFPKKFPAAGRNAAFGLRVLLVFALLFVAMLEAWLIDDAKITFRQVWNFISGDGMTFNFGERVQAFTHTAWFFLLSGVAFFTRELFISTLVLSIALSMAAVGLLLATERRAFAVDAGGDSVPLLTPALLLIFSVAFCDYMTSGLENPLSYFLVGLLLWLLAADNERYRQWVFVVLSLLVLNRFDFAALFLPLALLLAWTSLRAGGGRGLCRDVWPGVLLLGGWLVFATVYFGSPLPNSFYAKMASGLPSDSLREWAAGYFIKTAQEDPISLTIIAAGIALSLASGQRVLLALAAGQILYLGFIVQAGGDWMPSGRFFAVPVFLAVGQVILLGADKSRAGAKVSATVTTLLLVALALSFLPRVQSPLAFAASHFNEDDPLRTSKAAERGKHGLFALSGWQIEEEWQIAEHPPQQVDYYATACYAGRPSLGPAPVLRIDICAVTEPFLARLPAVAGHEWNRAGHGIRKVPTDYGEFLTGRTPTIADESLHGLLRDITLATRSPTLFSMERFAAIWRLHSGHYRKLDRSRYRDPAVTIPVVSKTVRHEVPFDLLNRAAKPRYHHWQAADVLTGFFYNPLHITIDPPRHAVGLHFSLGHMEKYEVYVNGELIETIEPKYSLRMHELGTHYLALPQPMWVESIEVRPSGHNLFGGAYVIGHLHIH